MIVQWLADSEAVDDLFEKGIDDIDVTGGGLEATLEFHHVSDFFVLRDTAKLFAAVASHFLAEFLILKANARRIQFLSNGGNCFVEERSVGSRDKVR